MHHPGHVRAVIDRRCILHRTVRRGIRTDPLRHDERASGVGYFISSEIHAAHNVVSIVEVMIDAIDDGLRQAQRLELILRRHHQQRLGARSIPDILDVQFTVENLHGLGVVLKLCRSKEEGAVCLEWPSDRAAKLLPETNLVSLERIVLGQIVIAEQIKTGSVELVGSRFRCQVDDAARRSAELRRECTAEDLKLLQGLHCERRRNLHMPAPVCIGVIAAIYIDVRE